MQDSEFWEFVEHIHWGQQYEDPAVLKPLVELLYQRHGKRKMKSFRTVASRHQWQLFQLLAPHWNQDLEADWHLPQLSWDQFHDLTCHIVGLGQKAFEEVLAEPSKCMDYLDSYAENFFYIFNEPSDPNQSVSPLAGIVYQGDRIG